MSTIEALWLGIVQGLSEFLPVSSSGHLVMFQELFGGRTEAALLFEVGLHVATLVAIIIFYWRRILSLVIDACRGRAQAWRYAVKLGIATVPAGIVGLTLKDLIEAQFALPAVSGICLLITGCILWTTRTTLPRATAEEPGYRDALIIGVAQAFAILPGISRSGTTVATGLALGIKADKAAEFSFLMGVIAISGAAVLTAPDIDRVDPALLGSIGIGAIAALVSGVAAIWLFIKLLERKTFHAFSWYVWIVGAAFLGWLALR